MIPVLYDAKSMDFGHNGLGLLKDTISATVDETLNGSCELTIEYPVTARLFNEIVDESIFKVKANDVQDFQLFRAYNIVRDEFTSSIIVKAKHVTNDATSNFVEDFTVENITPGAALSKLFSSTAYPSKFSGTSDITTLSSTSIQRKNPLEIIAGVEGSLLDVWGGELVRDNFSINLLKRRGRDNVASIRYRKNLTGLETDVDTENVITRIYPFANKQDANGNEQTIVLPEKYLDSEHINAYSNIKILPVDYSSDEEVTDVTTLRNVAGKFFTNSKTDIPEINIKVSFEPLSEMRGYEKYKNLEMVELGDTVTVYHPDLNVNITAKAVRTKYNVITEKYEEIELGSIKADFTDTLKSDISKVIDEVPTQDWMQNELKAIGDSIQGANGGNIYTFPTFQPSTMYFMDTNNVNTAKKVMVMNREGIAFYQNGITGAPKTAWGIDGKFVADWIGAGTLRSINIESVNIVSSKVQADLFSAQFVPKDGDPSPLRYKLDLAGAGMIFQAIQRSNARNYTEIQLSESGIDFRFFNNGEIRTERSTSINDLGIETPSIANTGNIYLRSENEARVVDDSDFKIPGHDGSADSYVYRNIRAKGFIQHSTVERKQDFVKYEDAERIKATDIIKSAGVFEYRLKDDLATNSFDKKIGMLAEMLPEHLKTDGKSIDMYAVVTNLWQYARENEEEKQQMRKEIGELKELVYSLAEEE